MHRYVDYAAACLACALLVVAVVLPEPWTYMFLAAWTCGLTLYLLARARSRGGDTVEMDLLTDGHSFAGGHGASVVVAHLEVQCSRALLTRCAGPGPDADPVPVDEPGGRFDREALRSVMESDFVGSGSLTRWNQCSFPMRHYPRHPAEHAYTELLGPLRITGRMWHVLELHIDTAKLAAERGTASQAAATVRERLQGLLAHRGFSTRTIPEADHADIVRMWLAAPSDERALLSARRGQRPTEGFSLVVADDVLAPASPLDSMTPCAPPAQGAGPIVGADENDSAVCLDLCGPHIRTAVFAGRFESLEFLVLRSAALGRRAVAVADNPDRWHGLAVAADVDVVYSRHTIDTALNSGRDSPLSPALAGRCDVVYWDSETEMPGRLVGHVGGPTICRVLTGDSENIERRFAQQEFRAADLVVDGRVTGWFTIQIRGDISDRRPRMVTVQAVETAAEIACLAEGRSAPKPFETLTV